MPKKQTFGDILPEDLEVDVPGAKHLDDVVNKNIIVYQIVERTGDRGEFALIKAAFMSKPDETFALSTGAVVVMKQIYKAVSKDLLPLEGRIIQVEGKDYYNIVAPK